MGQRHYTWFRLSLSQNTELIPSFPPVLLSSCPPVLLSSSPASAHGLCIYVPPRLHRTWLVIINKHLTNGTTSGLITNLVGIHYIAILFNLNYIVPSCCVVFLILFCAVIQLSSDSFWLYAEVPTVYWVIKQKDNNNKIKIYKCAKGDLIN